MSKKDDEKKKKETEEPTDEQLRIAIGFGTLKILSLLFLEAASKFAVEIVDTIKAMPRDERIVTALNRANGLYKLKKELYAYLHDAEMQYGRDTQEYLNTLKEIMLKHDALASQLSILREQPETSLQNLLAERVSGKDIPATQMITFDVIAHDKTDSISRNAFPHTVFTLLYARSLIAVIDEETDKKNIDESFKSRLLDYKNGLLMDNPEVESWYLGKGFFGEGKMLDIDKDPEPEIMAYLGMPKEKYYERKALFVSKNCDTLLKEYKTTIGGDDFFDEYLTTLKIGAMFRLVDEDRINYMVETVKKTTGQVSRSPKILEKYAKREIRRREGN